jgi:hypothetical protein
VFVAIKWIMIGRYEPGRYPIWGSYYLRWCFCRNLFLRGVWGSNGTLLNFYYSLLEAKISEGARIILEADLEEFALVTVGRNASVEYATLRGFGVDNGVMILGLTVGNDASVGAKSVVAPFTSVPDGVHLVPVTSSYDVGKALDAKHARVNRRCLPEPNVYAQLFVGAPIPFLVNCIGPVPPVAVLFWMLEYKEHRGEMFSILNGLLEWLCDPSRISFYIGIRLARTLLSPFFYMGAAIIVKKLLISKFEAGSRDVGGYASLGSRRHYSLGKKYKT